ncbi:hypothetical protein BH23CHL5_BH23CHL5_16270 [soil metagenome]
MNESSQTIQLIGRFDPGSDREYRHHPFSVPTGVEQIGIEVEYNDQISSSVMVSGGNVLDIGIFDARGIESGSEGFRGWSGSDKRSIVIGEAWATPPYRPGPINSGEWNILLGPYKIGVSGLDYRVSIAFNPAIAPPIDELRAEFKPKHVPAPLEAGWIRGDLHCHSMASDGDSSSADLLRAAAAIGLDFLAITDHNSSMRPHLENVDLQLPLLITGIEVTTYGGHWNVWGVDRWFEFREPNRDTTQREMTLAAAAGGLVSINHPRPFGPEWDYGIDLGYHAIEVWNGPWPLLNVASLLFWELHLELGRRIVAIGGSDTHVLKSEAVGPVPRTKLGEPTVWVNSGPDVSESTILQALRDGRSFIAADPLGPQLYLTSSENHQVDLRVGYARGLSFMLISHGKCIAAHAVTADDWRQRITVPATAKYVRAQLVDSAGNIEALTNPIWFD